MMRVLTTSAGVVAMDASAPARPPMATTCHGANSRGFCPNASPADNGFFLTGVVQTVCHRLHARAERAAI